MGMKSIISNRPTVLMREFYGTWYQSGSISLIYVESGF